MTQLSVQIPDELKPFVDQVVSKGVFGSASDFITNLLYSAKDESESRLPVEDSEKLAKLRAALSIGIEDLRRGQVVEFNAEDIIQRGRARQSDRLAAHG